MVDFVGKINVPGATIAWLDGESDYQKGRFNPEASANDLLEFGVSEGSPWGQPFYKDYSGGNEFAEKVDLWPRPNGDGDIDLTAEGLHDAIISLQNAGKLAAVGRSLFVAVRAKRGELNAAMYDRSADFMGFFEEAEVTSLVRLAAAHNAMFEEAHQYDDVQTIGGTVIDELLQELDSKLPHEPDPAFVSTTAEDLADYVARETYWYFLDKTKDSVANHGGLLLPQPGVPRGEIIPWPKIEDFEVAA